jgi:hypothetical protein
MQPRRHKGTKTATKEEGVGPWWSEGGGFAKIAKRQRDKEEGEEPEKCEIE